MIGCNEVDENLHALKSGSGKKLSNISGVLDSSLFTNTVTKVLIASKDGIKLISKNR